MPPKPDSPKTELEKIPADALSRLWEQNFHIRERLRATEDGKAPRMVAWPDPRNKMASMAAIAMNVYVLKMLARWWCPQQSVPKCPSVHLLKKEASI